MRAAARVILRVTKFSPRLGYAVGRSGVEGCRLALRHLLHESEELRGRGLIDACLVLHTEDAYGLQQAEGTDGVGVGSVLGHVEADLDVALCGEVVDLVGLRQLDDADERAAVGHVAVVEVDGALALHVAHPLVKVEVLDASGVERRGAAHDAVHLIAFVDQKFGQVRSVLARDACD